MIGYQKALLICDGPGVYRPAFGEIPLMSAPSVFGHLAVSAVRMKFGCGLYQRPWTCETGVHPWHLRYPVRGRQSGGTERASGLVLKTSR
jgi:hypothetical protein